MAQPRRRRASRLKRILAQLGGSVAGGAAGEYLARGASMPTRIAAGMAGSWLGDRAARRRYGNNRGDKPQSKTSLAGSIGGTLLAGRMLAKRHRYLQFAGTLAGSMVGGYLAERSMRSARRAFNGWRGARMAAPAPRAGTSAALAG